MFEDKKLILEMLKEGKINVEEAEKLLSAQEDNYSATPLTKTSLNKKFLRVLVKEGDNTHVNINLPLALAEVGLQLVPKEQLKIGDKQINVDEIVNLIKEGAEGELVNVDTKDKGKDVTVKIYID